MVLKYSCAFILVAISTSGTFPVVAKLHSCFLPKGLLKYLKLSKYSHMVEIWELEKRNEIVPVILVLEHANT